MGLQCSLGYHHFEHPGEMTRRLARLLKPGGMLLVVDLMCRGGGEGEGRREGRAAREEGRVMSVCLSAIGPVVRAGV